MDIGPSSHRRATSRKRVSSPSAANICAETPDAEKPGADAPAPEPRDRTLRGFPARALRLLDKVRLDQLHLLAPAALVRRERLRPARQRNLVEAGFGNRQHGSV